MDKEMKEVLQSQLNNEEDVIKDLKKIYKQALDDCKSKIELLSARAELNPDNLQSVIYQKNYQEAIKAQLEGVMMGLDSDAYSTISEYLSKCYEEGFVGVMYDIAAQGIPMVVPIDPKQVMKAIQVDSKLSEKYYKGDPLKGRLDEDVKSLKKAVSSELSRGIANGSTWNQVAANLARNFKNTPFNKAYNDSIRIARTEGHRVQIQSALDAQEKAKAKGADIVKQWDSTLDGNTRPHHRQLDGQIREVEEPFELGNRKVKAPGMFGDPAEDCNCRCGLLQRARWALDDDELETLKERAAYHGLLVDDSKKFGQEKAKDFSDYKKKYSVAAKIEAQYNDAIKVEPSITNDIKKIADTLGVDLYGLEYRIKSKESYLEKMMKNGYDYEMKDIIRYTFGMNNPEEYTANVKSIVDNLKKMGYNTLEIKNYWLNNNNPYNGINTTVIEHKGQKFEVQFHTKESFEAKQKMHSLYEEQRKISDIYSPEYIELNDKMFEIADSITVPDGVRGIKYGK